MAKRRKSLRNLGRCTSNRRKPPQPSFLTKPFVLSGMIDVWPGRSRKYLLSRAHRPFEIHRRQCLSVTLDADARENSATKPSRTSFFTSTRPTARTTYKNE